MFTRGYCISWKIWENLLKCWSACFDLHKLSVNSISLAIPICEPWCWNMHTNICPSQITQFCRFLCTSTMVRSWDKLINFHGCPVSLLSQRLLTLQLLASINGTPIPLANNSMPFCLCGAPQWDFKLPFIDDVPIQTGCLDGATCRKFQCSSRDQSKSSIHNFYSLAMLLPSSRWGQGNNWASEGKSTGPIFFHAILCHRCLMFIPCSFESSIKMSGGGGLFHGETTINHPPITIFFLGGMFTIPSHGWFIIIYWFILRFLS